MWRGNLRSVMTSSVTCCDDADLTAAPSSELSGEGNRGERWREWRKGCEYLQVELSERTIAAGGRVKHTHS